MDTYFDAMQFFAYKKELASDAADKKVTTEFLQTKQDELATTVYSFMQKWTSSSSKNGKNKKPRPFVMCTDDRALSHLEEE